MKYYIAIPIYNGGHTWESAVKNIKKYISPDVFVHAVDSSSSDESVLIAEKAGFDILTIAAAEFNHGGTRNFLVENHIDKYDVVVFLTQDAIPAPGFLENIVSVFNDIDIACAYGRQLPHEDASPIAIHARMFNYREKSHVCGKGEVHKMGLKTVFMSNSFSAYRLSIFKELGGFPSNTILCEDMFYAAKAIQAGYKVAYVADAVVRHSHNYGPLDELKRYFDIGVFHANESWIRECFGGAGGEGKRFIFSEVKFLLRKSPHWIPLACVSNVMKFIGYKLGLGYKYLPVFLIKKISMHKKYWKS